LLERLRYINDEPISYVQTWRPTCRLKTEAPCCNCRPVITAWHREDKVVFDIAVDASLENRIQVKNFQRVLK